MVRFEPRPADLKFEVLTACPPSTLFNEGTNTDALLTEHEIKMAGQNEDFYLQDHHGQ